MIMDHGFESDEFGEAILEAIPAPEAPVPVEVAERVTCQEVGALAELDRSWKPMVFNLRPHSSSLMVKLPLSLS